MFIKRKASHFATTDKSENTFYRETHDLILEGAAHSGFPVKLPSTCGPEDTRLFGIRLHHVTNYTIKPCPVSLSKEYMKRSG